MKTPARCSTGPISDISLGPPSFYASSRVSNLHALLQGPEKTVLLGVPDDRVSEAFLAILGGAAAAANSITHVVLPNFGPKRLKALTEIMSHRPDEGAKGKIVLGLEFRV
jgi:hypothetical protein